MENEELEIRLKVLELKVEELTQRLSSYLQPKIRMLPSQLSARDIAEALNVPISKIHRGRGKFSSLKILAQKENGRLFWSNRDFEFWQREQNKTIAEKAAESIAKAKPVRRKGLIRR